MADQLELLQEANARGILPDNMKPLYQEAVSRGLIKSQPTMEDTISQAAQNRLGDIGPRLVGGLEGVANTAIKGLATPLIGLAGLTGNYDAANDFVNKNLQFSPQNKGIQEGQQASQNAIGSVMSAIPTIVEKGLDFVNKEAASGNPARFAPQLAQSNAGLQFAGNIAANLAPGAVMPRSTVKAAAPIEATPFKQARDLGLSIPPSYAHGKGGVTTAGPAIEGMVGGAPKTAVEASMKNQPIITSKAAEDIKTLDKTLPVSDETLDAAAQPYYEKYNAVKNLGKTIPIDGQFKNGVASIGQESADAFPMDSSPALDKLKQAYLQPDSFGSNGAVLKIRQLRKDGNLNIASRDPEKMQLGYAQRQIASLIEDQMERYATSRPEGFNAPNVIKDFKDARQQIAKIETLRDSIKPGTNDVSAAYLAKQLNRGAPLSGNMLKIAEAYNNFKPAMQDAGPLRNKVPVNRLDAMVGSAGAGIGAFKHSASPVLGAAGYILAPPLARKALLSDAYQNSMLPKPMNPDILKLIAPLAAQSLFTGNQK